jgi:hypothetical protein
MSTLYSRENVLAYKGAKPGDLACRAAHEVRAGDPPQDCEGARLDGSPVGAWAGGSDHPMTGSRAMNFHIKRDTNTHS